MRMASGWRSTPFRLRCRSATRSRRLMAAARTGRACGWLSSMVALPPIAAANGPTSMACATTWSAANPDRKALLCCRAVGWSNAALAGLRIGAACCATAPDGWMSQPGVSPSSPFCLVFRHCSIQCQSVPLDYENPTQTGSEWCVTVSIGEQPAGVVMAPPEVAQFVENRLWQRYQPLLVALADNTQHQVGPVNRADLQPGGLADTQAAGLHDGKACPVDRVMNAAEQMPDLILRQRLRQPLLTGGCNPFFPRTIPTRAQACDNTENGARTG